MSLMHSHSDVSAPGLLVIGTTGNSSFQTQPATQREHGDEQELKRFYAAKSPLGILGTRLRMRLESIKLRMGEGLFGNGKSGLLMGHADGYTSITPTIMIFTSR